MVAFTDPNDLLSYRLLPARYAAPDVAVADALPDFFNVERDLGNEDHVGPAGDPGVQRDPPGVGPITSTTRMRL